MAKSKQEFSMLLLEIQQFLHRRNENNESFKIPFTATQKPTSSNEQKTPQTINVTTKKQCSEITEMLVGWGPIKQLWPGIQAGRG